jgi:excisionase family DNA binding protein
MTTHDALESLKARAALPASQHFMNETELAEFLGLSKRTIQRLRLTGEGPAYRRIGKRRIAYLRSDIDAWTASRSRRSTSEYRPIAA